MRLNGNTSITRRLTILFVLASSGVLLALGLVIAASVEKHFEEQDMEVLTGKMELIQGALEKMKSKDDLESISQLLDISLVGHHGLEVMVLGADHVPMFSTSAAHIPVAFITSNAAQHPGKSRVWYQGDEAYRGIAAELATGAKDPAKVSVAVAVDMAHHQSFMRSFRQTLWLFVAGAAALTGLLGWAVARRGLAPLRAMRDKTKQITANQLSHRLPVESVPVELGELAQSLNEMLARLEEAFVRLSGFSSDIAHELRTPVSNLMTQTHVALSHDRGAAEYRSILESNAEEFERITRMISDMLLLAKAENGLVMPNCETVRVSSEVLALFDYYEAVAEEKGLRLTCEGDAQVNADRLMLRRGLGNLLSNAVRHASANTEVRVTIAENAEAVTIRMDNQGDPIPPEYLERVFDRFFRVDPARQRSTEGTGLGLAITKSIVLAHGGTISVASSDHLTSFTVSLPLPA